MQTVFTGWRTVTPGKCFECGSDDEWECDGRGTIYCACQNCPDCGEFDGHNIMCPTLNSNEDEEEDSAAYVDYHSTY